MGDAWFSKHGHIVMCSSIQFSLFSTEPEDFSFTLERSLVFDAEQRVQSFSIDIIDDREFEKQETFEVSLVLLSEGLNVLLEPSSVTVSIEDNDEPTDEGTIHTNQIL